jgi:hypothetical protein
MAVGLRALLVAAALPLAASLTAEFQRLVDRVAAKKTLVATVLKHTQEAPVDLMLSHQIRMLTSSHKNVGQVTVINAKVPMVDNALGTIHDPILGQMRRSYGTTGSVNIIELESNETRQQELMQKVFSVKKGSTAAFAKKFFKQDLTSPDLKRQMAYFNAMMQFIDLCSQAEYGVETCINMDGESFLHRQSKKGLIELSSDLFDEDEDVIALQPPTYCDYTQAHHKPSWAKKESWTNSSFTKCVANATKAKPEAGLANMLFSRQRLMAALPLSVNADDLDLNRGFDHAFLAGLAPASGAIKGMQCGHSFVIRPAGEEAKCKSSKHKMNLKGQALAAGKFKDSEASQRAALDTLSGEYSSFNQRVVQGIEVLADRMERGMIPGTTGNVGDKCMEMCPSEDRIKQGMAW